MRNVDTWLLAMKTCWLQEPKPALPPGRRMFWLTVDQRYAVLRELLAPLSETGQHR